MKIFEMKKGNLNISEEAWGYIPFKTILDKDKSPDKEKALLHMLFIWNFCDIKSDYMFITNEKQRTEEIKHDIGLPKSWRLTKDIKAGIAFYLKFETVIEKLYRSTLKAVNDVSDYLQNTDSLLKERNNQGNPVVDISKITTAVQKVPSLMANLRTSYTEVIKEQEETQGKTSGSKKFNLYEEGLEID